MPRARAEAKAKGAAASRKPLPTPRSKVAQNHLKCCSHRTAALLKRPACAPGSLDEVAPKSRTIGVGIPKTKAKTSPKAKGRPKAASLPTIVASLLESGPDDRLNGIGGSSTSAPESVASASSALAQCLRVNDVAQAGGRPRQCSQSASSQEKRQARYVRYPSFALEERIARALEQRLYLLTVHRHAADPGASFAVLGSTGNVYSVDFSSIPECNCPDFLRRGNLCKHVLFVWLRVLRCSEDDPRIWQKALLTSELRTAVDGFFQRTSGMPWADKATRLAFAAATKQSEGEFKIEEQFEGTRKRALIDEDECPVCFEDMTASEDGKSLLTFCCNCGHNFHKDCILRWQKASSGTCPCCRATWNFPSRIVRPGETLPAPKDTLVLSRSNSGYGVMYLNLQA